MDSSCSGSTTYQVGFVVTADEGFSMSFKFNDHLGSTVISDTYSTFGEAGLVDKAFTAGNMLLMPSGQDEVVYLGAYGDRLDQNNVSSEQARYTDHEYDQETGFNYMKGRYQFPMYAKFNRPDPMRDWDWTRPHTLNLYEYVGNDPINAWDPTGFLKKDKYGNLKIRRTRRFTERRPYVDPETGENASRRYEIVYIFANNGRKIKALLADEKTGFGAITDCHGITFTGGRLWINNGEVEKILKGDGYIQVAKPSVGDVVVYRALEKKEIKDAKGMILQTQEVGDIIHTTTVSSLNEDGSVSGVVGLGGRYSTLQETTPEGGWGKPAGIEYWSKPIEEKRFWLKKVFLYMKKMFNNGDEDANELVENKGEK